MWKDKIEGLKEEMAEFEEELNNGCSPENLKLFQDEVKQKFGYELPKEYIDFLGTINGFEYNGFIVYGVDDSISNEDNNQNVIGYIDSNRVWYENEHQKKYMFLGDSHISWYCFDIERKAYVELDKPSGALSATYKSFDDLLSKVITDS